MKAGNVVVSVCGHDKGCVYVILKEENDFFFVCDGKNKLLKNPKKKNKKHLKDTGVCIELSKYNPLYDAHIRKELKSFDKCVNSIICIQ